MAHVVADEARLLDQAMDVQLALLLGQAPHRVGGLQKHLLERVAALIEPFGAGPREGRRVEATRLQVLLIARMLFVAPTY